MWRRRSALRYNLSAVAFHLVVLASFSVAISFSAHHTARIRLASSHNNSRHYNNNSYTQKKLKDNARKHATPISLSPANLKSTESRRTLTIRSEDSVTTPTRRHVTAHKKTFSAIPNHSRLISADICVSYHLYLMKKHVNEIITKLPF